MCKIFRAVINQENCGTITMFEQAAIDYLVGLIMPFSTVMIAIVGVELLAWIAGLSNLLWCCGAGSLKVDADDSDDDDHPWLGDDEHDDESNRKRFRQI